MKSLVCVLCTCWIFYLSYLALKLKSYSMFEGRKNYFSECGAPKFVRALFGQTVCICPVRCFLADSYSKKLPTMPVGAPQKRKKIWQPRALTRQAHWIRWPCVLSNMAGEEEATAALKQVIPEVRAEYSQVYHLVHLLLVLLVASAQAERSFSALQRLNTWLWTSMTEVCLNSIAVCNFQQRKIDSLDIKPLMREFTTRSDNAYISFWTVCVWIGL